jgi:hypothetical protein
LWLVKLLVLVVRNVRARARPQRGARVGLSGLPILAARLAEEDRYSDVIRILADQRLEPRLFEEFLLALLQMQRHPRAARLTIDASNREFPLPVRIPVHAMANRQAGAAGFDLDAIRNDEGRVEADAELSDELSVLSRIAGHLLQELRGARSGDRPEVFDDLVARHADAVVRNGDRAAFGIVLHVYPELGIVGQQVRRCEGLESQLVGGVGGVGNQLAEEDFLVAVQRMDHEMQQLPHLGLEPQCLACGCPVHCLTLDTSAADTIVAVSEISSRPGHQTSMNGALSKTAAAAELRCPVAGDWRGAGAPGG